LSQETPASVVVTRDSKRGVERARTAAKIPIVLGTAFLLVGLVDLALLWIPVRLDSVAWEFATIGRTLDALPMPVLGLGLVAYGAVRHPRVGVGGMRGLAWVLAAVALVLIALGVLFTTLAPAVVAQTPAEALEGLHRAVIRHAVQSVVYPVALLVLAVLAWRSKRSQPL
jgi:hypothetical protein